MDPYKLLFLIQMANMLANFGIGAWLYLEKRNDKTNERITELAGKVSHMDMDVAALKSSAETAPSHNDLSQVYKSINELAATVNQLVGENRGQSESLRMILNQIAQKGMQ